MNINSGEPLVPTGTLMTANAEEGRRLAIELALQSVRIAQPDAQKREAFHEAYTNDPALLLEACHVVAIEFATIAAANNYWRK